MTFRETAAHIKARRTRRAIARMYAKDPAKAMDHINTKLDQASRGEVLRAQLQYLETLAGA